jgi:hypothetical protein
MGDLITSREHKEIAELLGRLVQQLKRIADALETTNLKSNTGQASGPASRR